MQVTTLVLVFCCAFGLAAGHLQAEYLWRDARLTRSREAIVQTRSRASRDEDRAAHQTSSRAPYKPANATGKIHISGSRIIKTSKWPSADSQASATPPVNAFQSNQSYPAHNITYTGAVASSRTSSISIGATHAFSLSYNATIPPSTLGVISAGRGTIASGTPSSKPSGLHNVTTPSNSGVGLASNTSLTFPGPLTSTSFEGAANSTGTISSSNSTAKDVSNPTQRNNTVADYLLNFTSTTDASSYSTVTTGPAFVTTTLTQITGVPLSVSETTTTNHGGAPTVIPVWFQNQGLAVLVLPLFDLFGDIPSPPGLPEVHIGDDGKATQKQSLSQDQTVKPTSASVLSSTASVSLSTTSASMNTTSWSSTTSVTSKANSTISTIVSTSTASQSNTSTWSSSSTQTNSTIVSTSMKTSLTTSDSQANTSTISLATSTLLNVTATSSRCTPTTNMPRNMTRTTTAYTKSSNSSATSVLLSITPSTLPILLPNSTDKMAGHKPNANLSTVAKSLCNPYLAFPINGLDPQLSNFTAQLRSALLGRVDVVSNSLMGVVYWMICMSPDELALFHNNPLVCFRRT